MEDCGTVSFGSRIRACLKMVFLLFIFNELNSLTAASTRVESSIKDGARFLFDTSDYSRPFILKQHKSSARTTNKRIDNPHYKRF
jgi:hypothetical protein